MADIEWYLTLYYKYRHYPVKHLNSTFKNNELRHIYANIFNRFTSYFHILTPLSLAPDSSKPPIESYTLISKASSFDFLTSTHQKIKSGTIPYSSTSRDHVIDSLDSQALISKLIIQLSSSLSGEVFCLLASKRVSRSSDTQNIKIATTTEMLTNRRLMEFDSSVEISGIFDIDSELSSLHADRQQFLGRSQIAPIQTQKLPKTSEQMNYFFMEFCSSIDVEFSKSPDASSFEDSFQSQTEGNSVQSLKSEYIASKKSKNTSSHHVSSDFDNFLLGFAKSQLAKANTTFGEVEPDLSQNSDRMNMLLETWIQILLMAEDDEKVVYGIIQELTRSEAVNTPQLPFLDKINSYLHYVTRTQSKRTMAESLSKQNFLILLPQFIMGARSLKDLKLEKCQGFIEVREAEGGRTIRNDDATQLLIKKWQQFGCITSELLTQDEQIFWAMAFHDCVALYDKVLLEATEFSYSLLLLREKLISRAKILSSTNSEEYIQRIEGVLWYEISEYWTEKGSAPRETERSPPRNPLMEERLSSATINPSLLNKVFNSFVFGSGKKTSSHITFELREWESVIHGEISRLRSLRLILETGVKMFGGQPQCVVAFFIESYRNLKYTQITCQNFCHEDVYDYCEVMYRLSRSLQEKLSGSQNIFKSKFERQGKNNHRQLGDSHKKGSKSLDGEQKKKLGNLAIMLEIESHQNTFKALVDEVAKRQFRDKHKEEPGVEDKPGTNKSMNSKSSSSSTPSSIQKNLELLESSLISNLISRVEHHKHRNELTLTELRVLNAVCEHLRLTNWCNFLSKLEWEEAQKQTEEEGREKKRLVILRSCQVAQDLEDIEREQKLYDAKKSSTQSQSRKLNSNFLRQSSLLNSRFDNAIGAESPNASLMRKSSIDMSMGVGHLSDPICQKIITKIEQHNALLETLVAVNYRRRQYHKREWGMRAEQNQPSDERLMRNLLKEYENINRKGVGRASGAEECSSSLGQNEGSQMDMFRARLENEIHNYDIREQMLLIASFTASLETDYRYFASIHTKQLVSSERMEKIKVVAKNYFNSLAQHISSQSKLKEYEGHYLCQLIPLLNSLIQLTYLHGRIPVVKKVATLLNKFFRRQTQNAQLREARKPAMNEDVVDLQKIIGEVFEWSSSSDGMEQMNELEFIEELLGLRMEEGSEEVAETLKQLMEEEKAAVRCCGSEAERNQQLQFKLNYLLMRELYFHLDYDVTLFEEKSPEAKNNYEIYEDKIIEFFEGIAHRDEEEFKTKKSEELKQRSAFLQGYLLYYEKEPDRNPEYRRLAKKVVSIFDKVLSMTYERRNLEMKKRGNSNGLNKQRMVSEPLYLAYLGTEYVRPQGPRVRVFDTASYNFYKAIEIYESMLEKEAHCGERRYSNYKESKPKLQLKGSHPMLVLNGEDIEFIRQNQQSIKALWINTEQKQIHENKMDLVRKNFVAKIERLYIDLDVRHKVFELFKEKILNYEMQKTKIYHQYMDYIRGLKLDVYSHVAGEDPMPYFKLINAIKFYRMGIKKEELDEKVYQEFGKNLRKWNEGIQEDMQIYESTVREEETHWRTVIEVCNKNKKELFEIHAIIEKELERNKSRKAAQLSQAPTRPGTSDVKSRTSQIKVRRVPSRQSSHRFANT